MCWSLSCVLLFATPWPVACQAPLSMGFSRQEYWSGLLVPSPGDLPKGFPHCRQILYHLNHQESPSMSLLKLFSVTLHWQIQWLILSILPVLSPCIICHCYSLLTSSSTFFIWSLSHSTLLFFHCFTDPSLS